MSKIISISDFTEHSHNKIFACNLFILALNVLASENKEKVVLESNPEASCLESSGGSPALLLSSQIKTGDTYSFNTRQSRPILLGLAKGSCDWSESLLGEARVALQTASRLQLLKQPLGSQLLVLLLHVFPAGACVKDTVLEFFIKRGQHTKAFRLHISS